MNTRVSIIQFQPELADPQENIKRLEPLIDAASDSLLIVLPELSDSGYNFTSRGQAVQCAETIGESGLFQDFIIRKTKEKGNFIVSGINEKAGEKLYNSAILAGPNGIIGKYQKLHLFVNEKDIFEPGNAGLPVFDIGPIRIGISICFDYLFPEPWGIMARKGADLICHPSNLLTENPRKCLPGIAFSNKIYVATANRIGTERDLTFNGESFFTLPNGNIVNMLSPDLPGITSIEIDTELSRNKMITKRNHAFDDRRPEVYHP
jgi:predicted amidohydrolase